MRSNEKAGSVVATESGSKTKTFLIAGGNQKRFDVFDYAEKTSETQVDCLLCSPQIGKVSTANLKLCGSCTATQNRLESELIAHLSKPRKIIRLHRCASCQKTVTATKFSRDWAICKSCVSEVVNKSKIARSNFVERAVNNFRKMLKGVAAL